MSIFNRKKKEEPVVRNETLTVSNATDAEWRIFLGLTGEDIDPLQVSAVFRCVDIISKTMAALPLDLFRYVDNGREKAEDHPLYNMMHRLPNEYTTAYEFWQMGIANLLLTEGMYAKIKRDSRGRITSVWNIPTKYVTAKKFTDSERTIEVTDEDGNAETLHEGDFFYIPSFRYTSPFKSEKPLSIAASVLGLIASAEDYSHKALEGANPGGFVTYPGQMSDKSYERFKDSFRQNYEGAQNAGKWLFLEEGATAEQFTRDMEKQQVLETRKWAVSEVCRIFGVPPHMCMDLEHATFSNIEQQSMEFVRDCIEPLCVRLEQALYRDLLSRIEKKSYFWKFNLNSLMRGDTATRAAYYNTMRQTGIMNANEIRALEDMNGIGEQGDIYCVNGNLIPLTEVPNNKPKGSRQQ